MNKRDSGRILAAWVAGRSIHIHVSLLLPSRRCLASRTYTGPAKTIGRVLPARPAPVETRETPRKFTPNPWRNFISPGSRAAVAVTQTHGPRIDRPRSDAHVRPKIVGKSTAAFKSRNNSPTGRLADR